MGGADLILHTDDGVTLDAWLLPADPSTDRAAAVLYAPEQTLYLGESIVTGVVARLQSTHAPAGVLLRSPFPDFVVVAGEDYGFLPTGMLLRDRFPVIAHVEDSQVPITVLYGSADTIVPPSFSSEVAKSVNNLSEEIVLEGVGHNDPEMFGAPVGEALERLADRVLD